MLGAQGLPRGARVRVKLGEIDEITLDVSGTVIERLDAAPDARATRPMKMKTTKLSAGPIAIAVDVNEADAAPPAIIPHP